MILSSIRDTISFHISRRLELNLLGRHALNATDNYLGSVVDRLCSECGGLGCTFNSHDNDCEALEVDCEISSYEPDCMSELFHDQTNDQFVAMHSF